MNVLLGDNDCLENAFFNYSGMIYRIAFQYVKNKADSEDILQRVYIKLIEKHPAFESNEHMKAWLIRAAVNLSKDYIRFSWRHKTTELTDNLSQECNPDSIKDELFKLSKKYRIVLYLYYYEQYKISEIAELLNVSPNTISGQLQRARKQLKLIIEEGDDQDEGKRLYSYN